MLFSERYGYEPQKPLQVESMDVDLKTAIHNCLRIYELENKSDMGDNLYLEIWSKFFLMDIDIYYKYDFNILYIQNIIKDKYIKLQWFGVYDYLEFYVEHFSFYKDVIIRELNNFFEQYNFA